MKEAVADPILVKSTIATRLICVGISEVDNVVHGYSQNSSMTGYVLIGVVYNDKEKSIKSPKTRSPKLNYE